MLTCADPAEGSKATESKETLDHGMSTQNQHPGSRAAVSSAAAVKDLFNFCDRDMAMMRISFLFAVATSTVASAGTCQQAVEAAYASCPREIGCPTACKPPACAAIVACPPGSTYTLNGTTYTAERVQSLAEAFFSRCSCTATASAEETERVATVFP